MEQFNNILDILIFAIPQLKIKTDFMNQSKMIRFIQSKTSTTYYKQELLSAMPIELWELKSMKELIHLTKNLKRHIWEVFTI